jgi:hypothetical protein
VKRLLVGGVVAVAVLLIGAVAAGASTTPAGVSEQDTASTRAYIASAERLDAAEIKRIPAITAREAAFVARASSGCSGVLAGVPARGNAMQQLAVTKFGSEVGAALEIDALQPVRQLIQRIGTVQEHLRFSDPVLHWQVGVDASATPAYLAIGPPDLCADARALAASHFTKLTPAGERFVQNVSTVLLAAAAPPVGLLPRMRAYAPAAVAAALKRLPVLQRRFDQPLRLTGHAKTIMNSLFGIGFGHAPSA